jgi:hypothetical protein
MPYTVIDEGEEPNLDLFEKMLGQALMRAANVVRNAMAEAPIKKPGTKHLNGPLPGGFYSKRQRGFVMGSIEKGMLQVPYIRTGNLPRSWSISSPEKVKDGLVVFVFSDPSEAPYNEWVQQDDPNSKRQQVKMHEDWLTPGEAEKKYSKQVTDEIEKELRKWGFRP